MAHPGDPLAHVAKDQGCALECENAPETEAKESIASASHGKNALRVMRHGNEHRAMRLHEAQDREAEIAAPDADGTACAESGAETFGKAD